MARRTVLAAASLGVVLVLTAGCGGGGAGIRDPAAWGGALCSASSTWQRLTSDTVRSTRRKGMTRARLQKTVDDTKHTTEAFAGVLTGLGQPNTPAGAEAQDTVNGLAAD